MTNPVRAERMRICEQFWNELLERAQHDEGPRTRFVPQAEDYVDLLTNKRGIKFCYVIREHDAEVVLVIETLKGAAMNQRAFDALMSHRAEIEEALGGSLEWAARRNTARRRVGHLIGLGGYRDRAGWLVIQEEMLRCMRRLQEAFEAHIKRLNFVPDTA